MDRIFVIGALLFSLFLAIFVGQHIVREAQAWQWYSKMIVGLIGLAFGGLVLRYRAAGGVSGAGVAIGIALAGAILFFWGIIQILF